VNKEALAIKKNEPLSPETLARRLGQLILDKKGENLVIIDVRERATYADFILIASARSARHVQGLADFIEDRLYQERISPLGVEGKTEGQWILLDYGDVVVHLFYGPVREIYDLEGLWMDAPRIEPEQWGLKAFGEGDED
jgi:ribosome-associated protein